MNLIDVVAKRLRSRITLPVEEVFHLQFVPNQPLLAAMCREKEQTRVVFWDLQSEQIRERFPDAGKKPLFNLTTDLSPCDFAFGSDGKVLAANMSAGTAVWDLSLNKLRHEIITQGESVYSIALSCDGKILAVVEKKWRLRFFDTVTGQERGAFFDRLPDEPTSLCFSQDGQWLVAALRGGRRKPGEILQVSVKDMNPAVRYIVHEPGASELLAISPDGKQLATCNMTIRLWDMTTLVPPTGGPRKP